LHQNHITWGIEVKLNAIPLYAAFLTSAAWAADPQADGRTYMSQGDSVAAAKKFGEAVQINPFDAAALNNQAVAYATQGEYDKALQLLERANKISPDRTDIAANLKELRAWLNRNNPQLSTSQKAPIMDTYPQAGNVPPEPPALWKK
jgi:tetratricopeptide (TPR) repeat protein